MSSRTPTECVELASDASADEDDREGAIRELRTANECDELAALALKDDLERQFRRQALQALGAPQCDSTLRRLVEEESLEEPLRGDAVDLLDETDDS